MGIAKSLFVFPAHLSLLGYLILKILKMKRISMVYIYITIMSIHSSEGTENKEE